MKIIRLAMLGLAINSTLFSAEALAEGCNFPSSFVHRQEAQFEKLPPSPPYIIAGGLKFTPKQPKLLSPQIDTTIFVTPDSIDPDLVDVRAEIVFDGAKFQEGLTNAFLGSDYWNSYKSRYSSCENRIGNPDITIVNITPRTVEFRLDVVVENHFCGPLETGFKKAAGHVHGPIILRQITSLDFNNRETIDDIEISAGPFALATSQEQDIFFSILKATPLGAQASLLGLDYDKFKDSMNTQLASQIEGPYSVDYYFRQFADGIESELRTGGAGYFKKGKLEKISLSDMQFVKDSSDAFSLKLIFDLISQERKGHVCSALHRFFNF